MVAATSPRLLGAEQCFEHDAILLGDAMSPLGATVSSGVGDHEADGESAMGTQLQ